AMMRTITVNSNDAGQRLDKFLLKLMPTMPKGMLYKLIRKKDIRYNGTRCKGAEVLSEGDVLTVYAKEEFFAVNTEYTFLKAAGHPEVVYEDCNILVLYKPSGMFAHGGKNSLLDEVQKYLYDKGLYRPKTEQSFAPALCNRIDRNTEGLVIAAANAAALRTMNEAIRDRNVHKQYLAVTAAPLPRKEDTCTAWLKKSEYNNQVTVRQNMPDKTWKCIRTRYKVLAQNGRQQLVRIELLTGRTHQIRAHLAFLGAPLLGDPKYGQQSRNEENQCLCAYSLHFTELSDTTLSALDGKTITAPVPPFVHRYFPDVTLE
ncbi:MAG: RluA family pseudouridine synthase, partial [Oscillospiraceae bacterium]|nr:RluA family pseudouridine synthase [Oscillospiraceae bacterium]